jgi:glyoxylate reductase
MPGGALDRLAEQAEVDLWPGDLPPPYEALVARTAEADGLICMLTDRIDAALIAGAPRLRAISQMAAGYDNIDMTAARSRGIPVGHTPGVLTEATADLTFALILALARHLIDAERFAHDGRWRTWDPGALLGLELNEATLGIIGFGKIGRAVARRARGFGMRVIYATRTPVATDLGEAAALDALLRTSDIVSVHVPLTAETTHMVGERELRLMKRSAYLINTARGPVVDQEVLVRALREGWIAGAGLDVAEVEPAPADDPLLSAPNLLLLPHIGSATFATRSRMADIAVDNCLAALRGEPLPHRVAAPGGGAC